jgi:hypothetical protein
VSAFETFETLQGYSDTPTAEQQLSPANSWRITPVGTRCRRSASAFETFETLRGYSDTPTAEQQLSPTNSWRTSPVDKFHLVPFFKPIGIS